LKTQIDSYFKIFYLENI